MSTTDTVVVTLHALPRDTADAIGDIVAAIDAAQHSVRAIFYSLTLATITDALIRAHTRGVSVRVIADVTQVSDVKMAGQIKTLLLAGVGVWIGTSVFHALIHDKCLVIDAESEPSDAQPKAWRDAQATGTPIVVEGSFNLTVSGMRQMNTCCLFGSLAIARDLAGIFDQHVAWLGTNEARFQPGDAQNWVPPKLLASTTAP